MRQRADIWIAFYPSDFLAGTRGMTPTEIGVYIVLLSMMFERDGYVDLEEKRLARLCGCTPATFKKILASLMADGKIERGPRGLYNNRAIFEVKRRETLSINGAKGAAARWGKDQENQGQDDATAMQGQSGGNASPDANYSYSYIRTDDEDSRARENSQDRQEKAKTPPPARDDDPLQMTHRERLLEAMGVGPDGVTANGRFLGKTSDMALVKGWMTLGISEAEQIRVVTEVMTRKLATGDGSPPASFKYFDPAMVELATAKAGHTARNGTRQRGEPLDIAGMVKKAAEKVRDAN